MRTILKTVLKTVRAGIFWGLIVLIATVIANRALGLIAWKNVLLWVIPFPVGLILGEGKVIVRWTVNIFRAVGLVIEQEKNPKVFIRPYVKYIDFYPEPLKGPDLDYIKVTLQWESALLYRVNITDIKGDFSIDGSHPADTLNSSQEICINPFTWEQPNLKPIIINVKRDSFETVKRMRQEKRGKGSFTIKLAVSLNGVNQTYDVNDGYMYVSY